MEEVKYPISEIFDSPQGEGVHAGVMMTFIRLAGCTVGKPISMNRGLPVYITECTTYDGRKFCCDTDYRVKERLTVEEIVARVPEGIGHVCLTGGEPLMHYLTPLVLELDKRCQVHIETSGTIPLSKAFRTADDGVPHDLESLIWLTVSPKVGVLPEMLDAADEIKLLVDENFDEAKLPEGISFVDERVFIQPINYEHDIKNENLKLCLELQKKHPKWRLSLQLHKILSEFVGERIR